jgi:hypothetical protein
MNFLL